MESAKIVAVAQRSLTLRLNENVHGFVSARNAKDGEPIKNLKDKYKWVLGVFFMCKHDGLHAHTTVAIV